MKKITSLFGSFALLLTISLNSCSKNEKSDQIKPAETVEVQNLKHFFAGTAKVDVSLINYDQSKDEFSINGKGVISRTKLLMFYGFKDLKPIHIQAHVQVTK
jgi:hypothetical protein